ncbi:MAG: class I SAM-dependent methyltransferase [Promethearchaeota archaeon]
MATILMTLAEKKAPNKYECLINFLTFGRRGRIYTYIKENYLHKNQFLLDAGCGTGRFIEIADATWVDHIGIDISEKMLQQARKRFFGRKSLPCLVRSSITALPLKLELFDIILCSLVLSELNYEGVKKTLNEFHSCLKTNGILILVTESIPTSRIKRLVINLLRFPAYIIATTFVKVPKHPIHDITTLLSTFGSIIDQKHYLNGHLTLFIIKKEAK